MLICVISCMRGPLSQMSCTDSPKLKSPAESSMSSIEDDCCELGIDSRKPWLEYQASMSCLGSSESSEEPSQDFIFRSRRRRAWKIREVLVTIISGYSGHTVKAWSVSSPLPMRRMRSSISSSPRGFLQRYSRCSISASSANVVRSLKRMLMGEWGSLKTSWAMGLARGKANTSEYLEASAK